MRYITPARPRSQTLRRASGQSALMGTITLSCALALGGWTASIWMTAQPLGIISAVLSTVGMTVGLALIRDAWRLRRLADRASLDEWVRGGKQ